MVYAIRLPDGTIVQNIPDELSPEDAKARIIKGMPELAPAKPAGFSAADTGIAALQGVVGAGKSVTDFFGAGNTASEYLDEKQKALQSAISPERQAEMARRRALEEQAAKSGKGEVSTYLGGITEAPLQSLAQGLGSAAPALIAAGATLVAGAPAAIVGAVGFATKYLLGAIQGAGAVKGSIYDATYEALRKQGRSEEDAKRQAIEAQSYLGKNKDNILVGTGLGVLAGGTGLEKALFKGAGKQAEKGLLRRGLTEGAKEALPEGLQGGQEQFAQNVALSREGFETPAFQGVLGSAARDAAVGALTGAAVSPLTRQKTPEAAVPPGTPGASTPIEQAQLDKAAAEAAAQAKAEAAAQTKLDKAAAKAAEKEVKTQAGIDAANAAVPQGGNLDIFGAPPEGKRATKQTDLFGNPVAPTAVEEAGEPTTVAQAAQEPTVEEQGAQQAIPGLETFPLTHLTNMGVPKTSTMVRAYAAEGTNAIDLSDPKAVETLIGRLSGWIKASKGNPKPEIQNAVKEFSNVIPMLRQHLESLTPTTEEAPSVEPTVESPSGAGVSVASEPGTETTPAGVGTTESSGVVSTGEDVTGTVGGEAAAPPPVITQSAKELLESIDVGGGTPAFMTNKLKQIAADNGIEVLSSDTPNSVIDKIRDKVKPPAAKPAAFTAPDVGTVSVRHAAPPTKRKIVGASSKITLEDTLADLEIDPDVNKGKVKAFASKLLKSGVISQRTMKTIDSFIADRDMGPQDLIDELKLALAEHRDTGKPAKISEAHAAAPTSPKFEAAVAEGNVRKALQDIIQNPDTHPLTRFIAQRIIQSKMLPKVKVVPADSLGVDPDGSGRYRAGEYDTATDTIQIDERNVDAPTVIHEIIHGFLHQKISEYVQGGRVDAQVKRIDDLFQYLKANHPELAEQYGMTDLSEFASEAMSNREFQEQLKAIPYKKGNFFAEFAKAVLRILGITDKNASWNALAEALISVESAMQAGRAMQESRTGMPMRVGSAIDSGPNNTTTPGYLYHRSSYDNLANVANGDTFTLQPGPQGAEGRGVYFSQDTVVRPTTAEGTANKSQTGVIAIKTPAKNGWYVSKLGKTVKYNKPRTWHTDNKPINLKVVDVKYVNGEKIIFAEPISSWGTPSVGSANPSLISSPGNIAAAQQTNIVNLNGPASILQNAQQALKGGSAEKVRVAFADRLAALDKKLFQGYGGKIRDAFGNVNPSVLLAQALDFLRVGENSLLLGGLGKTTDQIYAATDLTLNPDGTGGPANMQEIFRIIIADAKAGKKDFKQTLHAVGTMLVGHREHALRAYNALPTTTDPIVLKLTDAQIDDLEAKYQASPETQKILAIMDAMRFNRIDMMVDAGRISPDKAQMWKDNTAYVPYDSMDAALEKAMTKGTGAGKGLSGVAAYRSLAGSTVQVGDPVKAFMDQMIRMTGDAMRVNAVSKSLRDLTLLGHARRAYKPATTAEAKYRVSTYINGVKVEYHVDDPLDVAAFAGMPSEVPDILQAMQKVTQTLRAGVTLMPGFALGQLFQDTVRAYAFSEVMNPAALIPRTLMNFPRIAFGELTGMKSKVVKEMERLGIVGNYDTTTHTTVKNILLEQGVEKRGIIGSILHFGESLSKASDLSVRQAIYEQTLKETTSPQRPTGDQALAETRAREIINFSRRGDNNTLNFLTRTVPFMGAYTRGLDKLYTAATGGANAYGLTTKEARNLFGKRMMTLSAMGLAYAFMKAGDEEYEEQPDYVRDGNIILPGAKQLGFLPAIPMPRDLAFVFLAMPQRLVQYMRKNGTPEEQTGVRVIGELMRQGLVTIASPNITPVAIRPILENLVNYSFFMDRPLESQAQTQMESFERFGTGTSSTAKALSKGAWDISQSLQNMGFSKNIAGAVEISPIKLENLFRGILGTSAEMTVAMTDMLINPTRTDRPMHKSIAAMVTGATAIMKDPVGRRQLNDLYDLSNETKMAKNTFNRLEKDDPVAAEEYAKTHYAEIQMNDYVAGLMKDINDLRNDAHMVDISTDIPSDERQRITSEITRQQNMIANDVYALRAAMGKERRMLNP